MSTSPTFPSDDFRLSYLTETDFMKYFLIAGEPSGDAHGATLVRELKLQDPAAVFVFCGGDLMTAEAGVEPLIHIREMAFMGFVTVLKNLPAIRRNFRICKQAIADFQPDRVVMIDYPGFNMRMAKYIRQRTDIPVYYYIAPAVWAWKSYRVKQIRRDVSRVLAIFPFEKEFFARFNYEVDYVGNPSVDAVHTFLQENNDATEFRKKNKLSDKPIIALLPGSRKQEIADCLPKMIAAASRFPDHQIVISGVSTMSDDFYKEVMQGAKEVMLGTKELLQGAAYPVLVSQTFPLLKHAAAAVVKSGTSTLETALIGTPEVVVYSALWGRLSYWIKEVLINIPYIALANILSGKLIVKELYAHLFTVEALSEELSKLLYDDAYRNQLFQSYAELREIMGKPGAAARAAESIINHQS